MNKSKKYIIEVSQIRKFMKSRILNPNITAEDRIRKFFGIDVANDFVYRKLSICSKQKSEHFIVLVASDH